MPAIAFTFRVISVTFDPRLFSVHECADSAYNAWRTAIPENRLYFTDSLLTPAALAIALRATPLPVVQGPVRANRRATYKVVGGFHIYFQLQAYATTEALKPLKATLLCIRPPKGHDWDARHLELLSQARLLLDNAGRARPIAEYREIYLQTTSIGWPSLRHPKISLQRMSNSFGIPIGQLRLRPRRDTSTAHEDSADDDR